MHLPTTHLLYLHGFRSSPASAKARTVAARLAERHPAVIWWAPHLPPSPRAAMAQVMDGIAGWPHASMAVIGSSLGGFYATWIAAQTGCRAGLLNPAVHPARDLARYLSQQTARHAPDEAFYFQAEYVNELRALECPGRPASAQVYAVIARGDEVLDWSEMTGRYPGARIKLLDGGNHALSDFDDHLDALMAAIGLPS